MRYIENYTDQEIYNMDEMQKIALVDLECARNGAPVMIGLPPEKPEQKVFSHDFEFYEVTSFKCDKETMTRLMSALEGGVFYERDYSSEVIKKTSNQYSVASVTPSTGFSENKYNEIRLEKEAYDILIGEYNNKSRDHNADVADRSESIRSVSDRFDEAWENVHKIETAKIEWNKYLQLSDGDEKIAMNFMRSRYPEEEFIKQVVPSYFGPDCAPAPEEA